MNENNIDRRTFVGGVAGAVLATVPLASQARQAREKQANRIRVGVIGCGSVSHSYLPHLANSPHVELVSACDIIPERAKAQAEAYAIPNQYPHIDLLLAGAAFDLLVNLTDMQEHERLNRQAVEAGKHVWSEKPLANSLAAGQALLARAKARPPVSRDALAREMFAWIGAATTVKDGMLGITATAVPAPAPA